MSKRNGYKITVTEQIDEIMAALEKTGIHVEISEPIRGRNTRVIKAEDAPAAGEAFTDPEKDPQRYIYPNEIQHALKPYINAIQKFQHTVSNDTGSFTRKTTYEVKDGEFIKINTEKERNNIR